MRTIQHQTGPREFYAPATPITTDEPGRIERFVNSLYLVHRFRGGVTARRQ